MACRIPCLCPACRARLTGPVAERYRNPRDDCEYWEMYQGWNDWKTISFEPDVTCDGEELQYSLSMPIKAVAERMAKGINVGGYGAYLVEDDPKTKYYLVKWTEEPRQVEADGYETCGEDEYYLQEGDWVCKGVWLNYVPRAQFWYTVGLTEVLVQCQTVLHADVPLQPYHETANPLPERMNARTRDEAVAKNPLLVTGQDHDFLMDAAGDLEGLDYEMVVPGEVDSDDDFSGDEDSDEEDEMDIES